MARSRVYEVAGSEIITPEGRRMARNARANDGGIALVDAYDEAKRLRERFYGKAIAHEEEFNIEWPRFLCYVGVTNAEQYVSDKKLAHWKRELFKHIAEAPQYLFFNPQCTTLVNDRSEQIEFREAGRKLGAPEGKEQPRVFYTRTYTMRGPMPKQFAILAEDRGVQWVTSDGKYWEARIPNCTLAAAPMTDSMRRNGSKAKAFLFSYSPEGVHYVVTGDKLDVTEDGIVY